MSSRKQNKDSKKEKKYITHSKEYTYLNPEEEEEENRIVAAELATHFLSDHGHFGKSGKRTSRKRTRRRINKRIKPGRRTSKIRSRSFGSFNTDEHLRQFLIITLFILIRSAIKGQYSHNINNDLSSLEDNAFQVLTLTSILELLEKIVGKEGRDKILLAYTAYSIGSIAFN
jgi:hypothetical protein